MGGGVISMDDSAWPLIVGTCPVHMSDASVPPLISFFARVHARKERFATIIDTRPLRTMPSAKWRKDITAWSTDPAVMAATNRYNVATAIVTPSALARGVFVALGWLRKPPSPERALETMSEAARWCDELFARGAVPLTYKARALLDALLAGGGAGSGPESRVAR